MATPITKKTPIKTPGAKKQPILRSKTMTDMCILTETKQTITGTMDLTADIPASVIWDTTGAMTIEEARPAHNITIITTNQNITTKEIPTTGTVTNPDAQTRTVVAGAQ